MGCQKRFTVLQSVLKLMKLKASNAWSDNSFTKLMGLIHEMLPKGNKLPTNTNEAKKLILPLSLDVVTIHVCRNHYILY